MKHIRKAVIQQDDLTGDLYVTIPEEVLKDLTWEEGDVVEWTLKSEVEPVSYTHLTLPTK